MNNKILKVGFRYLIIIVILGTIAIVIPNRIINKELQTDEIQEEVPLQNAVEEKVEEKKEIKKQVKKITKKVNKKKITKKSKPRKIITPKVTGTKAQYQAYAHDLVINKYGWSEYDFECLVKLWNRESGWNPLAENKKSKARGIPQSLPASKMASEGADYMTNGYTQIRWGLKYIKSRYGSPAKAWAHSQKKGWY